MAVNTVQGRSVSCVPEQVGWPYGFQVQWCTAVPLQHGCLCLCTGVVVYTFLCVFQLRIACFMPSLLPSTT